MKEELQAFDQTNNNISRLEIIKFSFQQLDNFFIFGYGSGAYEAVFQLKFLNTSNMFANHAHSDLIEFFGEFGIIGVSLFVLSFLKFFTIKKSYNLINLILFSYLFTILLFDFSIHIPVIQILFVIFFQ